MAKTQEHAVASTASTGTKGNQQQKIVQTVVENGRLVADTSSHELGVKN